MGLGLHEYWSRVARIHQHSAAGQSTCFKAYGASWVLMVCRCCDPRLNSTATDTRIAPHGGALVNLMAPADQQVCTHPSSRGLSKCLLLLLARVLSRDSRPSFGFTARACIEMCPTHPSFAESHRVNLGLDPFPSLTELSVACLPSRLPSSAPAPRPWSSPTATLATWSSWPWVASPPSRVSAPRRSTCLW
eukprot:5016-Pyramimonas_sp.AAC.1